MKCIFSLARTVVGDLSLVISNEFPFLYIHVISLVQISINMAFSLSPFNCCGEDSTS